MNNKFIGMLGIARKARKVILGYDNIIKNKRAVLLLVLSDGAADRTKKNVEALDKQVLKVDMTKTELGKVFGAGEVSVAAITDDGIAKQLIENVKNGEVVNWD
ncbi:MAG: ribosomal protein L7Ae family protein [Clostridia bacterium]|nr:ribosomal protein L7Ae family protein [Clostridia bacterium]